MRRVRGNLHVQLSRSQLTLFCAVRRRWRTRRASAFMTKRSPARRFSVRSTLIEASRARRTEAIDVPRVLSGKVRFISGVVSTGSKSRQPTSADSVRRLGVCKASPSPSPSTDPKRNAVRRRSAHATLRSGTRASRRKFVSLSFSTSAHRLRVCSSVHGNHHPSAAWLGLL